MHNSEWTHDQDIVDVAQHTHSCHEVLEERRETVWVANLHQQLHSCILIHGSINATLHLSREKQGYAAVACVWSKLGGLDRECAVALASASTSGNHNGLLRSTWARCKGPAAGTSGSRPKTSKVDAFNDSIGRALEFGFRTFSHIHCADSLVCGDDLGIHDNVHRASLAAHTQQRHIGIVFTQVVRNVDLPLDVCAGRNGR